MTIEKQIAGFRDQSAEDVIRWAIGTYQGGIAIASSFSMEDVAVIDLASRIQPDIRVFAIDTGRLNEETYECAEAVRLRYKLAIEWVFPRHAPVETLEKDKGLYSFRESIAARQKCCAIRKVEPLARALQGLQAWITGMRREQGVTRTDLEKIQQDSRHGGLIKVNPLADWTLAQLVDYTEQNRLPVNKLYGRGYTSIGCAPCTRATRPGDDVRAGRWWWEDPQHKECGLHGR